MARHRFTPFATGHGTWSNGIYLYSLESGNQVTTGKHLRRINAMDARQSSETVP